MLVDACCYCSRGTIAKKRARGFSLASLQKSLEKSFQIVRLKLANRFVRRETLLG
jgi:hypothetical protein